MEPKKELGQNFLFDKNILETIASYAALTTSDLVLEIGPGLGTLTSELCARAGRVVAVEFDRELTGKLKSNINLYRQESQANPLDLANLAIYNQDFLQFDLSKLPTDYKVVANIPYNITSKIIAKLTTNDNRAQTIVLLVQKEVADRLVSEPGDLSVMAIAAQINYDIKPGIIVPALMFTPVPKVASRVVIMRRRTTPLVLPQDVAQLMYVVQAGFSQKRKKLRSSLAVGLHTTKTEVERLLSDASIDPNSRAQALTIDEWKRLAKIE